MEERRFNFKDLVIGLAINVILLGLALSAMGGVIALLLFVIKTIVNIVTT